MPSPVSNHRPAAIDNQSEPDHQSLADDEEYEEIEVEEETEVEEDETDDNDEDEEEDDFGEVLSPINQDQTRDASPDNVILEHEDQSHPVLLTQENAVNVKSTDMHEVEGDKGVHSSVQMDVSERRGSNSLHVNLLCSELGKDVIATGDHKYIEPNPHSRSRTHKDDVEQKNTALPNGNGILTAQTIESARSAGAESSAAVSMKDNLGGKTTALYYSEEKKKQSLQNEDFKLNETRFSRSEIPTLKPSSLSPGVEFKAGTDKPAIICDFFAQGWCIKGKSCRFLHVSNKTTQQHSGAEADASHKTERRTSEGSDWSSKKPRLATSPDEVAPAVSRSLDRLLSHELGQSLKWKNESEEASPYKDNSSSAGREYLRGENWYLNNHGKHGSEELAATRSQFTLDERMPPLRRSWEANFNSGKLPTHVPSWTKSSLPFGSTWNLDPLKSHKCLDVEREYGASRSASLQKTPSPFSGSESNNPSRMPVSGDSQHPAGYKTEVPSFRWEVSAPFRPSFDLTKRLLSSVYQYDPIRDSIEQSNLADVYSRFSGAGQESIVSGYNVGEQSLGRNQNILDSNLNKINYGKDLFSAETGTPLSAITEMQNKVAAPKEEKLLESLYIQDIKKRNTPNTENDEYATQTDSSRQKLKSGDMAGRISEMEVGVKVSEDIAKETKALKHFRAALIEFVKELVKPTWREGNLSKDAHKTIVKRAVDKVLSTIPAHQIPFTSEAVDLYLSSSQSKISKLVEGYIDKYGKI